MKITIKEIKDELPLSQEKAIEMAKEQLSKTGHFAALYGKSINGVKKFFTPILMDEKSLQKENEELLEKDPDGRLYVIYKSHLDDAPLYEIEYKNGEAWVDIPEEEINEFIKNRLIQIANSPRLIEKYKSDLEDLLEKDLQEYANQQFYEKGRGQVYKDSKKPTYDLVYYDLDLELENENGTCKVTRDFEYELDQDEVLEALYEILEEKEEFENMEEKEFEKYVSENVSQLFDKYEKDLLIHFEEDAIKAAQKYYNEEE